MMVELEKISAGVCQMLRVNLGVRPGERVLVVTDIPSPQQWESFRPVELEAITRRAYLARVVAEIATQKLPDCRVTFFCFPCTGRSGTEPGDEAAARMKAADVVIAITSFSISHTVAREEACRAGARVASMPRFIPEMFHADGPLAADYDLIARDVELMADRLTRGKIARVVCPAGTDICCSIAGRPGGRDTGRYTTRGAWGNLPAGEAYCAPVEGTAQGVIAVTPEWHPGLREEMRLVFSAGEVEGVQGGGEVGEQLRALLEIGRRPGEMAKKRRNLAELGVGANPHARRIDITVEAEKIKGTVHLALGDSSHMGGKVSADYHQDFVIPRPTLYVDDDCLIKAGEWR